MRLSFVFPHLLKTNIYRRIDQPFSSICDVEKTDSWRNILFETEQSWHKYLIIFKVSLCFENSKFNSSHFWYQFNLTKTVTTQELQILNFLVRKKGSLLWLKRIHYRRKNYLGKKYRWSHHLKFNFWSDPYRSDFCQFFFHKASAVISAKSLHNNKQQSFFCELGNDVKIHLVGIRFQGYALREIFWWFFATRQKKLVGYFR